MMKMCVSQQQQQQQQSSQDDSNHRFQIGSPALFDYDENSYTCPVSYAGESTRSEQQNSINQNNGTAQPSVIMAGQQLTTSAYNQSNSPSSIDSVNNFTPSPSRAFEYPGSPCTKPSIPANTDYPGDYDFHIDFGELTDYAPKSAQYTYSKALNKLFVKMNVTCPIRFKCAARLPPHGCLIRAIPVFKRPEHVTDVVTRCPNHKIPDEVHYIPPGHLIRAESTNECHVDYHVANDGRESVTVLYERPQVGAEYSTVLYKFMCLSSCVGGINRRPLLTCFTLEKDGQVLGRRVVEVRICSCPGRDRSQEERRKRSNKNGADPSGAGASSRSFRYGKGQQALLEATTAATGGKKRRYLQTSGDAGVGKAGDGDDGSFVLHIRGREKFEYLRRMKEALDLMEMINPAQIDAYRRSDDEEQISFFKQFKIEGSKFDSNDLSQGSGGLQQQQQQQQQLPPTASASSIKTSYSISEPSPQITHHHQQQEHNSIFQQLTTTSSTPPPSLTHTPTGTASPEEGGTVAGTPTPTTSYGGYWGFVDPLGCDVPEMSSSASHSKESWLESLQENMVVTTSATSELSNKSMESSSQLNGLTLLESCGRNQNTNFQSSTTANFHQSNGSRMRGGGGMKRQVSSAELFTNLTPYGKMNDVEPVARSDDVTVKREGGGDDDRKSSSSSTALLMGGGSHHY